MFFTLSNILLLATCYLIVCFPEYYLIALFRSYTVQLAILGYMGIVFFLLKQKPIHYGISIISTLLSISTFFTSMNHSEHRPNGVVDFTVAHFNVYKFNHDFDSVIQSAVETDADLISFMEIDSKWDVKLKEKLMDDYPYIVSIPRESCCYGLSIFSKTKIHNADVEWFGEHPNVTGAIDVNDTTVQFVCSHTAAPTSLNRFKNRNDQIDEISNYVNNLDTPVLVIGDFNSVPWDVNINSFKKATGLSDSRKSLCPTYPAWLTALMIPIDFIFHSNELFCSSFSNIDTHSSDHYGVVGKYHLKL